MLLTIPNDSLPQIVCKIELSIGKFILNSFYCIKFYHKHYKDSEFCQITIEKCKSLYVKGHN